MTVTGMHKKWLIYFACTLIPAYWVANWRHETNLSAIQEKLQREEAFHLSTEKLIKNCASNANKENHPFDANYQICAQGVKIRERTAQQIEALNHEKMTNDSHWYQNFILCVSILNLLGFLAFKSRRLLEE
jgi:hypothetical protein